LPASTALVWIISISKPSTVTLPSESTNIYDPSWPLWKAYLTLARQWRLLFRIAIANRAAGHRSSTLRELTRDLLRHYRGPRPLALAD